MVVAAGLCADQFHVDRVRFEMLKRGFHFKQKRVRHLSREAVADENALDYQRLFGGEPRLRIGGDEPAALTQEVGVVVQGEAGGCGVFELPAEAGNAIAAVVDDLEWAKFRDLLCQITA